MSGSQIQTSVTILNSLLGFQAISLTNFDSSAESVIAAGSKVEIAGAFFTFDSDETPQASTWTAISTGSTAYITCTPSGTAGSQIVTVKYSDTAPTWDDAKQGWYLSSGSTIRYVGGVYKEGATQYDSAFILDERKQRELPQLETHIYTFTGWNMDLTTSKSVSHDLPDITKIAAVTATIFRNDGTQAVVAGGTDTTLADGTNVVGIEYITAGAIVLSRQNSGYCDNANWNDAYGTIMIMVQI